MSSTERVISSIERTESLPKIRESAGNSPKVNNKRGKSLGRALFFNRSAEKIRSHIISRGTG